MQPLGPGCPKLGAGSEQELTVAGQFCQLLPRVQHAGPLGRSADPHTRPSKPLSAGQTLLSATKDPGQHRRSPVPRREISAGLFRGNQGGHPSCLLVTQECARPWIPELAKTIRTVSHTELQPLEGRLDFMIISGPSKAILLLNNSPSGPAPVTLLAGHKTSERDRSQAELDYLTRYAGSRSLPHAVSHRTTDSKL